MHNNNFDFLRLLFAVFVIYSHSYPAALGPTHTNDFFGSLFHLNLSVVGLSGFFAISGYLIYQSLRRSSSLWEYVKKRALRIFPGLAGVLLFTSVFFVFLSDYSFLDYFSSSDPYFYFLTNVNLYTYPQLSILDTIENNPSNDIINVSLWTIKYEFLLYLFLIPFFFISNKATKIVLAISFLVFWILKHPQFFLIRHFVDLGKDPSTKNVLGDTAFIWFYILYFALIFITSAFLASISFEKFKNRNIWLWSSVVIIAFSLYFDKFHFFQGIFFPILIISLGLNSTPIISGLSKKIGDWSYGTYLYGYVIQQVLVKYFKLSPIQLALVAIPISLFFGLLSWNLIEKRFLRLKRPKLSP